MFDIHYISEHYNLLFILYLLIFVGYLEKLISCNLDKFISDNIYLKHLIGLFCLIFLVILVEAKQKYTEEYMFFKNLFWAVIMYIIFILSNKLDFVSFWVFIILLCITFILRHYTESLDDVIFKEKKEYLNKIIIYLEIINVIILIITIIYYDIIKSRKIKNFNMFSYIFNEVKCKIHEK